MVPPVQAWIIPLATAGSALSLGMLAVAGACRRWRRGRSDLFARRLEVLDERVSRLETTLARLSDATPTLNSPLAARTVRLDRPADGPSAALGPTLIAVPDLSVPATASRPPASPSSEIGRRFGEVWELADAGAPAEEIARATGHPIGQVELILRLRHQAARESQVAGRPETVLP